MSNDKKKDFVQNNIKLLLQNIYDPNYGMPIEDITKNIWQNWRAFDGPRFRKEANYIERQIGEIRARTKQDYYEKITDASREDNPRIAEYFVSPPDFLPYALKRNEFYWTYFNCVKRPWTEYVEKICRQKADGLIAAADFLDKAFKL